MYSLMISLRYCNNTVYNICINQLFMLLVRFPLNSRPQIVKVLHGFLSVCVGVNVPNPPCCSRVKGQLYIVL